MKSNNTDEPKIDFVGKVIIEADEPKILANWYTEKFGLKVNLEVSGEFHGNFRNKKINFYIEIIKAKQSIKYQSNIQLIFHVENFKNYLHDLKIKYIIPFKTFTSHEGDYDFFKDPENNIIAIQGTLN